MHRVLSNRVPHLLVSAPPRVTLHVDGRTPVIDAVAVLVLGDVVPEVVDGTGFTSVGLA